MTGDPVRGSFQAIAERLDYPMFVVTATDGIERAGCLVGFATQCSIEPRRMLVCLSKQNRTAVVAREVDSLVVHVLRSGDRDLAVRFGELTGDEVDKFAGLDVTVAPGGAPVISGLDWFQGDVHARHDLGDHVGYVLDVEATVGAAIRARESPLGFQQVHGLEPGHPA